MEERQAISVAFDLATGLSPGRSSIRRSLSALKGIFSDSAAWASAVGAGDPLVYEFFDLGVAGSPGEIAFGTTITYPGKVGAEYFMTKGHFHGILETAEVYYCLRGEGILLMENPEGDWKAPSLSAGLAVYVPPRYAHRSINLSPSEPLISFFAFRGDAGHDYATIESRGFRNLVLERAGQPEIVPNPAWGRGGEGRTP